MSAFVPYGYPIILFLCAITVGEFFWDRRIRGVDRSKGELLTNLFIFVIGNEIQVRVCNVVQAELLSSVRAKIYPLLNIQDHWLSFAAAFVTVDFFLYWLHRLEHLQPLWIAHSVHHSGNEYNMGAAARTPWLHLPLLMLTTIPTVMIGFSPETAAAALAYNLTFQLFQHASRWPEIPYLDWVIVTSEYHSRHHARNDVYRDCNFSAIIPWWDWIFRTYQPMTEPTTFQNPDSIAGCSPFKVNFLPIFRVGGWIATKLPKSQRRPVAHRFMNVWSDYEVPNFDQPCANYSACGLRASRQKDQNQ